MFVYLALHLLSTSLFQLLSRNLINKGVHKKIITTSWVIGLGVGGLVVFLIRYAPKGEVLDQLANIPTNNWYWILLAIISFVVLMLVNGTAVKHLDANTFSLLMNFRLILAPIVGIIIFSETVNQFRYLGGFVILVAIAIIAIATKRRYDNIGIFWGLMAAVVLTTISSIEKHIIKVTPVETYMAIGFTFGAIIVTTINLKDLKQLKELLNTQMLLLSTSRFFSAYFFVKSLSVGEYSLVSFISSSSIIIIAFMSYFLLKEKENLKPKIISTMITVLGIYIIYLAG
jgi:drug/metabolite transporter (DMT)-like permease